MPRRLTRTDTFRLLLIFCIRNHYSIPLSSLRRNVSARISLRGLRRLMWVDTLRRGNTVGFLVEWLIWHLSLTFTRDINFYTLLDLQNQTRNITALWDSLCILCIPALCSMGIILLSMFLFICTWIRKQEHQRMAIIVSVDSGPHSLSGLASFKVA